MRRLAWLTLPALALGACLYDVEDVVTGAPDASAGGDTGANDVGGEGWLGGAGGLDGGGDAASDAPPEAASDASDAPGEGASDASDAQPDAGPAWSSCKKLGYEGVCFGNNTVLYFATSACGDSDKCRVNNCSLKGGSCTYKGPGCAGWSCEPQIDDLQAERCFEWATARCHDNTVIKADPNDPSNCLYKECGTKKCDADAAVVDCY